MTSKEIKYALIKYYRYDRGMDFVGTEVYVGSNIADVVAGNEYNIFEVEVKVDKHDFRNDFKKHKHYYVDNFMDEYSFKLPNKMYFAVPEELKEFAFEYLINKPYGLLVVDNDYQVRTTKQAKKIHEKYAMSIKESCIRRMTTEYTSMYDRYQSITKDQEKHKKIYEKIKFQVSHRTCEHCEFRDRRYHREDAECLLLGWKIKDVDKNNCEKFWS